MLDGIDFAILIWLLAGTLAGVGEFLTGTLFLLPFAIGGIVAAVAVALGANTMVAVLTFCGVTLVVLAWVLRFGRRSVDEPPATTEGARRYVGAKGIVTVALADQAAGRVRLGTEIWRALPYSSEPIEPGVRIRVVEIRGNALVVEPAADGVVSD